MENPPQIDHLFRPHHICLLTFIILVFKEFDVRRLPPPFFLSILRIVLNECSEVAAPKSRAQILKLLMSAPNALDSVDAQRFILALKDVHTNIETPEQMSKFFSGLPALFTDQEDLPEPSYLMRRSFLGYFVRRCYASSIKLSFVGMSKLVADYQAWCAGDSKAGYEFVAKNQLDSTDIFIFKTASDSSTWANPDDFEAFENARNAGDDINAVEHLRRFFEQHFHEGLDSGLRQHASLHLVRMHYIRGEYSAAREILTEAIHTSRINGDRFTLQHCISMLNRLPPEDGDKSIINQLQPDLHPFEILYDVKKFVAEQNEQPLITAFVKLTEALAIFDQWTDTEMILYNPDDQFAFHVVESIIWSTAGCSRLSDIEDWITISFTSPDTGNHERLVTLLNHAYKVARGGEYDKALSMLLRPQVWVSMVIDDYALWAAEIWHILALRTVRRGQMRMYEEYLIPRRPPGEFNPRRYVIQASVLPRSKSEKISDSLFEVIQLRDVGQSAHAIEQLLSALWNAEFLHRLHNYRTAIILLADVGLEYGIGRRSRKILEEIMPQIIQGEPEQRALACFVLARCVLVSENNSDAARRQAIGYLNSTENDYGRLQMYGAMSDVQHILAAIYETLEMVDEQKNALARWEATLVTLESLEGSVVDEDFERIFNIIYQVGAKITGVPSDNVR